MRINVTTDQGILVDTITIRKDEEVSSIGWSAVSMEIRDAVERAREMENELMSDEDLEKLSAVDELDADERWLESLGDNQAEVQADQVEEFSGDFPYTIEDEETNPDKWTDYSAAHRNC